MKKSLLALVLAALVAPVAFADDTNSAGNAAGNSDMASGDAASGDAAAAPKKMVKHKHTKHMKHKDGSESTMTKEKTEKTEKSPAEGDGASHD